MYYLSRLSSGLNDIYNIDSKVTRCEVQIAVVAEAAEVRGSYLSYASVLHAAAACLTRSHAHRSFSPHAMMHSLEQVVGICVHAA